MMKRWTAAATLIVGSLMMAGAEARDPVSSRWIATWGSAQMIPEAENALPLDRSTDFTLRQVVRLSAGGTRIRVRLSNAFGTRPLRIGGAHVARATVPGTAAIAPGSALHFAGRPDAVIPPGAEIYSDAISIDAAAGSDLGVTLYLPDAPSPQTGHPGARATSFLLSGNHLADRSLSGARATTRWYALADIEVEASGNSGTVVAIGDSITDGYGVTPDRNARWPDFLAERLRARTGTRSIGVVNAGIGGNRVLLDGLGPNLLARFDRDVVARSGVRWAIVLEGINDLGVLTRDAPATPAQHDAIVAQVTAAYGQMAERAHAHGIKLIGGTVMPFGGNDYYHPDARLEAARQAINRFIRTSGTFDAVIDFDAVMRDPARTDQLAPRYDSGDHLHPSEAGYRAMGEAVPLTLFETGAVLGTGAVPVAALDAPAPVAGVDPRPAIALTFDDIPAHGPLPAGETRVGIIRALAAAFGTAKAPAFGFLNAGLGLDDPTAAEAIAAWRAAGLPLGNHTWSHANLDEVGAVAFASDVARNEGPLAASGADIDWHWFRYPFLSEGSTPAVRDAARAMLGSRGYKVAAVTMGFNDFNWNAPYAACMAKRDTKAIARLEAGFLSDARTAALDARAKAKAQVGRDIPYVLLMHVGAFDARMMPRLLDMYRSMGFRFTTLAEAQADPYYAPANDLSRAGPSPSLAGPPASTPLAGPPAGLCA